MSKTVAVSIRIDSTNNKRLEKLAAQTERSKSWLLNQALDSYLETQAWQIEHVKQGLAELKAGKGIPHSEVRAEIQRRLNRRSNGKRR